METKNIDKKLINSKNLRQVEKIVEDIKYGSVTLIIQDGVLIQIEKNEKIRLK